MSDQPMTLVDFLQAKLDQLPATIPSVEAQRRIVQLYLDEAERSTQPPALGTESPRLGALADVCQILAEAHGWQPD